MYLFAPAVVIVAGGKIREHMCFVFPVVFAGRHVLPAHLIDLGWYTDYLPLLVEVTQPSWKYSKPHLQLAS